MTHESSNDSPRHEPGISPRRAARAARENAERQRAAAQAPAAGDPSADPDPAAATAPGGNPAGDPLPARHGTAHHHAAPAPGHQAPADAATASQESNLELPAATAASEEAARAAVAAQVLAEERARTAASERTKALDAAQRARTQSAQRARKEAIEAQRAAAERVRQTLRANAAPLRDRSAAARSAITPDSSRAAPSTGKPVVPAPGASAAAGPFDQDASRHRTGATEAVADPAASQAQALSTPGAQGPPARPATPPTVQKQETREARQEQTDAAGSAYPARGPEGLQVPGDNGAGVEMRQVGHEDPRAYPEASAAAHGRGNDDTDQHVIDPHHVGHQDADHYDAGHRDVRYPDVEHLPAAPYDGTGGYTVEPDESLERENLFLTTMAADPKARKTRRRRRNWVVLAVLLGFCAVIFGVVLFLQGLMERLNPHDFPAPGGAAVSFEVKSGWGPKQIGRELENRDIVASDKLFLEAIQLVDAENREIHPGTYDLRQEMPALDAATILIGEPAAKVSYVAIKQNTRLSGVLEEISKSTGLKLEDLQGLSEDPKAFGINSGAPNLEGYLHPGEYRFPLDADAKTVLKAMVDATAKTLKANGITDPGQQYHVLKIASILQAEARKDDYATVAGALENRLHPNNTETNGLLQVDSAVIYGLDRYTLQISGAEKVDASNPYNTYVHKGLPPTPIGSPGDPAIKAAANPTPNDYYYWVTVNTNTGETKFARTYAEHRVYQNEFRSWCAANTDVCK
ncbi:endolytic transglycosylase MltG [Arthrobacter sp. AQ5-05]|uniref:endolytic transglycosylase MltG n=1 Tax=Arthrobacter sp. AQ5-05 TaxID=2184581 RepID=UPI000DCCF09A|nr:endolytic transglycosylase MltG [Arthrobacter sp. AQ5-05]RAX49624.1 endolytic transglycosylase MltG [Arthrobacter sp. AQ5-05]